MSKAQQIKISLLQNELAKKERLIDDLEIQNKALLDAANGDTKAALALANEFRAQRDDALQKVAQHETTISVMSHFAPGGIAAPEIHSDKRTPALLIGVRSRGGTVTNVSSENACGVCITVSIRDFDNPDQIDVAKVENAYPGSAQEAREELPHRIEALARRAPLPENLRGPDIPGVPEETLLIALREIANWWHVPEFQRHDERNYFDRLKQIFEVAIKPEVKQMTANDAYDYWTKNVKLSFADMAKYGRGRSDQPRDPKRRRKAQKSNWQRVSLI